MHDIAEFLGRHDPFSGLDEAALESLAERVEVEFFAAEAVIVGPGAAPEDVVRVVRRGAVELVDEGRVFDLIGEGELFGHPAMLAALPAAFEARAHEDCLCYAIPAADVVPLLARSSALRLRAGSARRFGLEGPEGPESAGTGVPSRSAGSLLRGPALTCDPECSVRELVERMDAEGIDSALVRSGGGELGIITDRDLRRRVLATGLPVDSPVRELVSSPVVTVGEEATGAEVMLAMLDHDIRHLPVLSPRGEPIGVLTGDDLVAAEAGAPFLLRRAIARADGPEQLREAARGLHPVVVSMHRSGLAADHVCRVITVVADGLVRRAIELAIAREGPPPARFAWIALGSHGRREAMPSSDVDSGMAWEDGGEGGSGEPEEIRRYMRSLAADVGGSLRGVGWDLDAHGVTAASEFSASSIGEWRASIEDWVSRPAGERVLIAIMITLDGRILQGPGRGLDPKPFLREGGNRARLLGLMLRSALASRPPTGFLRDIVLEHTGEHRGTLDIKRGGLLPVVDLARYAALKAGVEATHTLERLRAAVDAGALEGEHARALAHAYELFAGLRLSHQARQLERGERPDDFLVARELDPLTRRYLREAFREVAAVQRAVGVELDASRGRI